MPVMIQRKLPESGRIRTGRKSPNGYPEKLTTFRLTSRDYQSLQQAAQIYGGTVSPWVGHDGEYDLITKANEIPVFIPPDSYSQWYELWGGGTCKKRCDGTDCSIPAGDEKQIVPCSCDPKRRACKLVTRASFLLPDLTNLGLWRLDTGSIYAAMEMPGLLDMLDACRRKNRPVEAVLALEIRTKVKTASDGKGGTKSTTNKFPVCTLRIRESYRAMLGESLQPVAQIEQAVKAGNILPAAPEAQDGVMEAEFKER